MRTKGEVVNTRLPDVDRAVLKSHFGPLVVNLGTSSMLDFEFNCVWSDGHVIEKWENF